MQFKLLSEFESLFKGKPYLHRNSTLGDHVAGFLFEDLFNLNRSSKLRQRIADRTHVLNKRNTTVGKSARRGDGSFGERVPSHTPTVIDGLMVALGEVAIIEIGAEVKILAKAMIKQIDRVCTDMLNQAAEFRRHSPSCICVGIIGVNYAPNYTSYEGTRTWPTDGKRHKHPISEAPIAEQRLVSRVDPDYDELLVLRFSAANVDPFSFSWLNYAETAKGYSALLVRVSRLYDERY